MRIEDAKIRIPESYKGNTKTKLRTSTYTEDYRGEYYNISVDKLFPFKNQAREFFDLKNLESLALTIKEHGIRQPLTVISSEDKDGCYEIVSGERRHRAAILIGLKTVPCIILHDRKTAEEVAIIENIQREDLHPIELMRGYKNLLDKKICLSMQHIANKLGVAKSTVVEIINLKNLSEEAQNTLIQNKIINRDFFRILCKSNVDEQKKMVDQYIENQSLLKKQDNGHIKKIRIVSLALLNGAVSIETNKLNKLSSEQKAEVKRELQKFVMNI